MKRSVPTVALHMQYKTSFLGAEKMRGEENLKTHSVKHSYHSLHYQIFYLLPGNDLSSNAHI